MFKDIHINGPFINNGVIGGQQIFNFTNSEHKARHAEEEKPNAEDNEDAEFEELGPREIEFKEVKYLEAETKEAEPAEVKTREAEPIIVETKVAGPTEVMDNEIDFKAQSENVNSKKEEKHKGGRKATKKVSFDSCITYPNKADLLKSCLHKETDTLDSPMERLKYIRGFYEVGLFNKRLPYETYIDEFPLLCRSTYYHWMGPNNNYDKEEFKIFMKYIRSIKPQFVG